jgi:hypothetical protein
MSRRNRHGRHAQPDSPVPAVTPATPGVVRPNAPSGVAVDVGGPVPGPRAASSAPVVASSSPAAAAAPQATAGTSTAARLEAIAPRNQQPAVTTEPPAGVAAPAQREDTGPTCTQAQLRRFIKSRPWIPMHELRRRFGIWGDDDDVSPVRNGTSMIFVGLPLAEARMLGELLASGDVGYELSLDPVTPVVVGVYPMRPVPRG